MIEVHQVIPSFAARDAIGHHTVRLQSALRDLGVGGGIWYSEADREAAPLGRPYREYERLPSSGATRYLMYQASTASPVVDWFRDRPERKLVDYHNVTPASLFGPWEPHVGAELAAARRQITSLAPYVDHALADSSYNEAELVDMGYRSTAVLPILFSPESFTAGPADHAELERLAARRKAGTVVLFVSRVAPHKGHHDLIKAFAAYRRAFDPNATLLLPGGPASHRYATALEAFVSELGLEGAVELPGSVPGPVLQAMYRAADVFVCLSDHEGFGVPLVESMAHDVPVIAYATTAVPETAGSAAVLLREKSPTAVAAAIDRVVHDQPLRAALIAAGRRRLEDLREERTVELLRSLVDRLTAAA